MSAGTVGAHLQRALDRIPRDGGPIKGLPYGLLSLCDMLSNFSFRQMHHVLVVLRSLEDIQHSSGSLTDAFTGNETCSKVQEALKLCQRTFLTLGAPHISAQCERLLTALGPSSMWSDIRVQVKVLRESIEHELGEHHFYHYPREKFAKVASFRYDWERIKTAFPDTLFDALSAVDCFALEHNTASVFHSMRVVEHGLRALAKERKITLAKNRPIEWANWQEVITALEAAAKVILMKNPSHARDRASDFYKGAIADLLFFKEYRNSVMHARARYGEHQALMVLERVYVFMNRLAEKIDHRGKRIPWGI